MIYFNIIYEYFFVLMHRTGIVKFFVNISSIDFTQALHYESLNYINDMLFIVYK